MRRLVPYLLFGLGISLGATVILPNQAHAGSRDFLAEMSSVGVSSEIAEPYFEQFLRYIETQLKWPVNSIAGQYFPDAKHAVDYLAAKKPGFAMLDPEVWLELRKKEDMTVVAEVHGKELDRGHLSVVVKGTAIKTLDDLKGKRVTSNHLASPRFLSKIVFDGKLDAAKDLKLQPTTRTNKGLTDLNNGEADATLLDDNQLASSKTLPFAAELHVIYTSPALPPMPVVALGKNAKKEDRDAITKELIAMCSEAKGSDVCKALHISKFNAPDQKSFDDVAKRFDK